MSFSEAKTQRFNEVENDVVPAPGESDQKVQTLDHLISNYAELIIKMEKLIEDDRNEMSLLAQNISELDSRILDLSDERDKLELKVQKLMVITEAVRRETLAAYRAECNERANALIREVKTAVQAEIVQVKTEGAALDEKLSQDAEILRSSITLEQLRSCTKRQESFLLELAEQKEKLSVLKDLIRTLATEVARSKRFEIVMADNLASFSTSIKRLAQRISEGKRLQHELKRDEDYINKLRNLLNIVRNNSQMVHE